MENQTDNQVNQKKDENIVILEINIKISEDRTIFFQLRKYDDMFLEIKKICDVDIDIKITGLRPGEKLYEERLMEEEGLERTPNELISIGKPLEVVKVKINNPVNGVGELLISSPTLLSGIYNQPELDQTLFEDGYFKTGDLASIRLSV